LFVSGFSQFRWLDKPSQAPYDVRTAAPVFRVIPFTADLS
jgi:hypothetical protein